jgi:hypothetical protein
MKKRILSLVLAITMFMSIFYAMSTVVFALDIDAIQKAGDQLDNLTDQLKNLDLNNLPLEVPTKDSIDTAPDIKTNMMIAARNTYTLGLQTNGRVLAKGFSVSGADGVSGWRGITMIAAGFDHSVGLKSDGTVVAAGSNDEGQCDVSDWKDIIAVAAGNATTIGLKKDGTVVGCGSNGFGCLDLSSWNNIVAIAAADVKTVGLKSDGTVLAIGKNCSGVLNTSSWKDIVSICASDSDIMGLDKNGKVYATYAFKRDVAKFANVVAIVGTEMYAAGLKKDGTVVTSSDIVDVSGWKNIIAIAGGTSHIVGLRSDGTVVSTEMDGAWKLGQTDVGGWQLKVQDKPVTTTPVATAPVATTPVTTTSRNALPTSSKVLVNGSDKAFDAYSIEGNNYFKLRDLAFVLNGTDKQFEVTWDSSKGAINMLSKKPYTATGGEMTKGNGKANNAALSTAKILIDGKEVPLTAYTMNGNNYFKLRDVMKAFDVYVGWDEAKNTILVDTSKGY